MVIGHSVSGDAFLRYSHYILKFIGFFLWNKMITFGKVPWVLEKNIYLPGVHRVLPEPIQPDLFIMLFRSFSEVENERTLSLGEALGVFYTITISLPFILGVEPVLRASPQGPTRIVVARSPLAHSLPQPGPTGIPPCTWTYDHPIILVTVEASLISEGSLQHLLPHFAVGAGQHLLVFLTVSGPWILKQGAQMWEAVFVVSSWREELCRASFFIAVRSF